MFRNAPKPDPKPKRSLAEITGGDESKIGASENKLRKITKATDASASFVSRPQEGSISYPTDNPEKASAKVASLDKFRYDKKPPRN